MKNLLLFFVGGLIILSACRKKEPVELPKNGVISESHCTNGVMDADEDGIDCGPTCEPCLLSWPIMGTVPATNTFEYIGTSVSFPSANVVSDTTSGALIVTATTGTGGTLTITFGTTTPDVFTTYQITQGTPTSTQVKMNYNDGTIYTATSGLDEIHLNRVNGKYSIVFTEILMNYSVGFGSDYTYTDGYINSSN